jgi:hypothetical protein
MVQRPDDPKVDAQMQEASQFRYNDEFFFDREEAARFAKAYPKVAFAILCPEIFEAFAPLDDETRACKRELQFRGYVTIFVGLAALCLAATEPMTVALLEGVGVDESWTRFISALAAVGAVFAFLAATRPWGLPSLKSNWLIKRYKLERMRQWRWQYFCRSLPEVVEASGTPERELEYQVSRRQAFLKFREDLDRNADKSFREIVSDTERSTKTFIIDSDLLFDDLKQRLITALNEAEKRDIGRELKGVYGEVRIGAQERYTKHITGTVGKFNTHPKIQRHWLHSAEEGLLSAIVGVHSFVAVVGFLAFVAAIGILAPSAALLKVLHALAVVLALAALAVRAVEDGLRPSEHLGRYLGYAAEARSIRSNFDAAQTPEQCAQAMITLERASYEEMVDFLKAGFRARYVL